MSDPVINILQRLDAVKAHGGYWSARCPAHDDSRASLSISKGDDGRALIKCHAGCQPLTIVRKLGLTLASLFPEDKRPRYSSGRIVATYDYLNAQGELIFQSVRFEPKDFRQRRPDGKGGWIWNLKGVQRVPFRLPDLLARPHEVTYLVEGEKDADALAALGLLATCNPGGAGKWVSDDSVLHGRRVVIIADADAPGRTHAQNIAQRLSDVADVRILELPGPGKDSSDWIAAGGTREQLVRLAESAFAIPARPRARRDQGLPEVALPGGAVPITDAAAELGRRLASTEQFFAFGGSVVAVRKDAIGGLVLDPRKAANLASDFESIARIVRVSDGKLVRATCSEPCAKLISNCRAFLDALLQLRLISSCPLLIERDGQLLEMVGYDRETGIYASGAPLVEQSIDEARELLTALLADFRFATPSDRSRALAALVTPALVFGGLLGGRAPVDLGEADESQAGKGFRNRITAAIYRSPLRILSPRKGGVGSLEESFDAELVRGANFVSFDNMRGKLDSPRLESFLTEDSYLARTPYSVNVSIDPRRVVVMLTSNKAELTQDLANRASVVRILKQPMSFKFRRFPEGDLLAHVEANQPHFLGAVFAVVRAWHAAGKPVSDVVRHDFRAWAGALDWIVQNLLGAAPLLEGHRDAQERVATPGLNWLRDVALVVDRAGRLGVPLRPYEVFDLLEQAGAAIPGIEDAVDLADEDTRQRAFRGIGQQLGRCFHRGSTATVDAFAVAREEGYDQAGRKQRTYRFDRVSRVTPNGPECAPESKPLFPESPESFSDIELEDIPCDTGRVTGDAHIGINANDSGHSGTFGKSTCHSGRLGEEGLEEFRI